MKRLFLIHSKKALAILPQIASEEALCYYLCPDYVEFTKLRDKFSGRIEVRNLSGIFDQTFQEIKHPFLKLISNINSAHNSFAWWGGQFASRNTESTSLLHNITYLFSAKKILSHEKGGVILIVRNPALADCITRLADGMGYQVVRHVGKKYPVFGTLYNWLNYGVKTFYFFWKVLQNRRAAFRQLRPLSQDQPKTKKIAVIRSWVTTGNFDKSDKFKERNFGPLAEWLRSRDFEVWNLPMFFNLSIKVSDVYTLMRQQGNILLAPDHYLKFSDYWKVMCQGLQRVRKRIGSAVIENVDISPLINEVLREDLNPNLLLLNMCEPLLRRLKDRGHEINFFYYPFEGNPPEKQFILSCRKHYPKSRVIGYQHTTFFPNQLAYHLAPHEESCHPLPDKIVCSGPMYAELHQKAGFPPNILMSGPNLRYESVYRSNGMHKSRVSPHKTVLLPLTCSHDMAYELFEKVRDAFQNGSGRKVYVRSHPLLSKKKLIGYLYKNRMEDFEFADDGIIQDWLPRVDAVVSSGYSITVLEAVSMSIPVIRVVPDNTFFYDPLHYESYPFKPVKSADEIRVQMDLIDTLLDRDKLLFVKIAGVVKQGFFTRPTEDNMRVFL